MFDTLFPCNHCSMFSFDEKTLEDHVHDHHRKSRIVANKDISDREDSSTLHVELKHSPEGFNHLNPFVHCVDQISIEDDYQHQLKLHENKTVATYIDSKFQYSSKFENKCTLLSHMNYCHQLLDRKQSQECTNQKSIDRLNRSKHVNSYKCMFCVRLVKKNSSKGHLQRHVDRKHKVNGEMWYYKCLRCPQSFRYKRNFELHIRQNSLGKCEETNALANDSLNFCEPPKDSKKYSLRRKLANNRNKVTIHVEDKQIFHCPICLTAYNSKLELQDHTKNHRFIPVTKFEGIKAEKAPLNAIQIHTLQ